MTRRVRQEISKNILNLILLCYTAGLVIVAHASYQLLSSMAVHLNNVTAVQDRGYATVDSGGNLNIGSFANGVFSSAGSVGVYQVVTTSDYAYEDYAFSSGATAGSAALAVDGYLNALAASTGGWGAVAEVQSISYDFSVAALPALPVPEPESWVLLLAGLSLTAVQRWITTSSAFASVLPALRMMCCWSPG
ncbi:hypothetical protein GJ698_11225 [Pseudoduganella sp. FT26W]|uniref:PEP-CTERM sorting domain-containing protein n=1 Tax=Duganella aquatilis TaxID=2666082 RepID=A0A844CXN5_9BURK|nr:PEP-CTERM sorting domain-containing protein [Duganella aquatilis]MRW84658.1 hypothetical protein [Duganella aquatilis]